MSSINSFYYSTYFPSVVQFEKNSEAAKKEEAGSIQQVNYNKNEQSECVQGWLNQHQNDYVAHAIWGVNIGKVIKRGAVLPSEAVLKECGEVEYEKGTTFGARGTRNLVNLTETDKMIFTELSEKQEAEFQQLQQKENSGLCLEERLELKSLNKTIFEGLSADQKELWVCFKGFLKTTDQLSSLFLEQLKNLKGDGLPKLSPEQRVRYSVLSKEKGI